MGAHEKTAVPVPPAVTDGEQPPTKCVENSIPDHAQKSKEKFDAMRRSFQGLDTNKLRTVTMSELYDTVYAPRLPLVENLLYAGTYLFVGAPKVGKSFFMAQLGYQISSGLPLWDGYPVRQSGVLYLALEDDYARLQNRLSRMFGVESTDNFHFAVYAKHLQTGLEKQLEQFLQEHPNSKLIIIDTLQKIRDSAAERYSYANDYEIVTQLKRFGDRHSLCLLIVHHSRKQEAADSFDTISGTNGLLGAADGAFIMQKEKRTDNRATLDVVGRDQPDQRLHLQFDRERCFWQLTQAETEPWKDAPNPLLEVVAAMLANKPGWTGSATNLAEQLQLTLQPNVLTRQLNVNAGRLLRDYGVVYESRRNRAGRILSFRLLDKA